MADGGDALRSFHEATKHSMQSLQSSRHYLDWENQPLPFKVYRDLAGEELPRRLEPSAMPALSAIIAPFEAHRQGRELDRAALARLLHFSLGVVRRRELADGSVHHFRAAPCTGALYHVDAYVACGDLSDLDAGVYHFGPHDFSLRRLRSGDFRGNLAEAAGADPQAAQAPAILVLASTYWRNAWKYQSRAYRHVFWDSGTILAQLLAQAAAEGFEARLLAGFADVAVERLCGLDPRREGVAALVPIGRGAPVPAPREVTPLELATEPLSRREVEYPMIAEAHGASALEQAAAVARWREAARPPETDAPPGDLVSLPVPELSGGDGLGAVILRRGSSRVFSRKPISTAALSTILAAASAPLHADYRREPSAPIVDLFLIVNAVEAVPSGTYRWGRETGALEQLSTGEYRREAGYLGLSQELPADAAVNVYAIADLDRIFGALGDRGYRAAQLDGAIAGGRIYLAAYAQRLGATGLTFFDDDVARFFGLDPRRFGVMFLTAAGVGAHLS